MRSGRECRRKNRMPNPRIASSRATPITTMSTSVSPGAVMKTGRWWDAAGCRELAILRRTGLDVRCPTEASDPQRECDQQNARRDRIAADHENQRDERAFRREQHDQS